MDIDWAGRSDADDAKRERIDDEMSDKLQRFDGLDEHELMQFAFQLDPEMGKDILESDINFYRDSELEETFNEMLDECYGADIQIGSGTYASSDILKRIDPIAYQCGLNEHVSQYAGVSIELDIDEEDWHGGDMMVRSDDWNSLILGADHLREAIMDRRPELQAEIEANRLSQSTKEAAGAWSPSPADADALVPSIAAGRRQEATSQQSRRL